MKKYFAAATVLLAIACNSSDDKKADDKTAEKADSSSQMINKEPKHELVKIELSPEDTTKGKGLLSGKFEIVGYKKDNVKVDLPKTFVKFTRNGEFSKNDGQNFYYKIEGDNYILMATKKDIISKSKIEFLNAEKTSFVIRNANEKTEFTYNKVN